MPIPRQSRSVVSRAVLSAAALVVLLSVSSAAVAEDAPVPGFQEVSRPTRTINKVLRWLMLEAEGKPAPYCDDAEFLRRASIDVIGRIATLEEYDRYFSDPPKTRREQLVERLLSQPEYARYWAKRWAGWLTQTTDAISPEAAQRLPAYRRGLTRWLEQELGVEKASYKTTVERLYTAVSAPADDGAVNFILANLGNPRPVAEWIDEGKFDSTALTSATGELFLGAALVCARCHDHPFDAAVRQRDFWALDACFRQLDVDGARLTDNLERHPSGIVLFEKRNSVFGGVTPALLGGAPAKIARRDKTPRRKELAQRLTAHRNFGPAFVDRMWGQFFGGRIAPAGMIFSLTDPDADETEAELVIRLGAAFTAKDMDDPRNLIRWVCASDAYNRKTVRQVADEAPSPLTRTDPFQRTGLRPLPADAYIDSVLTALQPKTGAATEAERVAWRDKRFGSLVEQLAPGADDASPTPLAPLFLLNDPRMQELLDVETSATLKTAVRLSRDDPRVGVDYLYRATFNRPCTDDEFREVRKLADADRIAPELLQDLVWALLNSSEFALKH